MSLLTRLVRRGVGDGSHARPRAAVPSPIESFALERESVESAPTASTPAVSASPPDVVLRKASPSFAATAMPASPTAHALPAPSVTATTAARPIDPVARPASTITLRETREVVTRITEPSVVRVEERSLVGAPARPSPPEGREEARPVPLPVPMISRSPRVVTSPSVGDEAPRPWVASTPAPSALSASPHSPKPSLSPVARSEAAPVAATTSPTAAPSPAPREASRSTADARPREATRASPAVVPPAAPSPAPLARGEARASASDAPRERPIEVRIGTIEVLTSEERAPTPPAPAPRGFDDYFLARSYVRRSL